MEGGMKNRIGVSPSPEVPFQETMFLARFLQKARDISGKSKTQMANNLGVNYGTVHNWENGLTLPTEEMIPLIVQEYRVIETELRDAIEKTRKTRKDELGARKNPPKPKITDKEGIVDTDFSTSHRVRGVSGWTHKKY